MLRNDWFGLKVGNMSRNSQGEDEKDHIENEDTSEGSPEASLSPRESGGSNSAFHCE